MLPPGAEHRTRRNEGADMNIEALAREAGAWGAPGLFMFHAEELTRFAALIRAQALEESHKTARLWADECDGLADHTDDHTCAGLRRLASDMREGKSWKP